MIPLTSHCDAPPHEDPSPHEIVSIFNDINIPLNHTLQGMLNEEPEHQRPRRGCGYTQASRFLADVINQSRSMDRDLRVFSEAGRRQIKKMITACRCLGGEEPDNLFFLRDMLRTFQEENPYFDEYISQLDALEKIPETLEFEESKLMTRLITSILGFKHSQAIPPVLTPCDEKLAIGTCPEAERYFLEFSGGHFRRSGIINIFTDHFGGAVMIEKVNVGDSHSCITLKNTSLNGIEIPAGSLLGAKYQSVPIDAKRCKDFNGVRLPISLADGFRYLRLTTLAVSPANRERAFSMHLKRQLQGNPCFDPLNTELADLLAIAM